MDAENDEFIIWIFSYDRLVCSYAQGEDMLPVVILCVAVLLFFWPRRKKSAEMTTAVAVNISGSLRMLVQRMMKDHLMVGAGMRTELARGQMEDAIELFEKRLILLKKWAPTKTMRYLVRRIEFGWYPHKDRLLRVPLREAVPGLLRENQDLTEFCNDLVEEIIRHSGSHATGVINIAGRQRMLSQRIAKNCVAMYWGVGGVSVWTEFHESVALFEEGMQRLMASRFNTPMVAVALERAAAMWARTRPDCQVGCSGSCLSADVYNITEALLVKMDRITTMYQDMLDGADHGLQLPDAQEKMDGAS
jgi:hypothetical protein